MYSLFHLSALYFVGLVTEYGQNNTIHRHEATQKKTKVLFFRSKDIKAKQYNATESL